MHLVLSNMGGDGGRERTGRDGRGRVISIDSTPRHFMYPRHGQTQALSQEVTEQEFFTPDWSTPPSMTVPVASQIGIYRKYIWSFHIDGHCKRGTRVFPSFLTKKEKSFAVALPTAGGDVSDAVP